MLYQIQNPSLSRIVTRRTDLKILPLILDGDTSHGISNGDGGDEDDVNIDGHGGSDDDGYGGCDYNDSGDVIVMDVVMALVVVVASLVVAMIILMAVIVDHQEGCIARD